MTRPSVSCIESRRLFLAPTSRELTRADLQGGSALARELGVSVPESWPPDLHSRPALEAVLQQLQDRAEHGWSTWYLVGRGADEGVIGVSSFKGRPETDGSVELAYSILPEYRNAGYASEAVARLVEWAFAHQAVIRVTAETFPYLAQSIRVLERNGFQREGQGSEYGVVRYVLERHRLA